MTDKSKDINDANDNEEGLINITPEKLFNPDNYSTIIVGKEGLTKKQIDLNTLIFSLNESEISNQEKIDILAKIKEQNGKTALLNCINSVDDYSKKAIFVAACWEIGFDFTNEILFFIELACINDYNICLEAITVIQTIENSISHTELNTAIEKVKKVLSQNTNTSLLLTDLINWLNDKKQE